jgi:hypothetical protein
MDQLELYHLLQSKMRPALDQAELDRLLSTPFAEAALILFGKIIAAAMAQTDVLQEHLIEAMERANASGQRDRAMASYFLSRFLSKYQLEFMNQGQMSNPGPNPQPDFSEPGTAAQPSVSERVDQFGRQVTHAGAVAQGLAAIRGAKF